MGVNLKTITPMELAYLTEVVRVGNDPLLLGIVDGCPPGTEGNQCSSSGSSCPDCIKKYIKSLDS